MKTKLHLIIYIATAVLFTACENEIPYNPKQQEPLLIMNTLLNAESAENYVFLHLNEGSKIGSLSEATLSLYVNGQLAESPQAMTPEDIYSDLKDYPDKEYYESFLKNIHFKKFRLTTVLHPGEDIRLEATAENGTYHVRSEVTVPQPAQILQVDTCLAYLRVYNRQELYRQFKVTLQDRPDEKNFYRLEIQNNFSYHCEWKEYLKDENGDFIKVEQGDSWNWAYIKKDTLITDQQTGLINREDVILTDGHPTSADDEENEMFPTIENKYNIFTDNRFSNSSATLKVYTPHYQDYYLTETNYDRIVRTHTATIRLLSLSEAEYRYLRALNCLDDDDYDESLMEPISLPSNVEGGLGFVGICSETKYVMEFSKEEYPNYQN